MRRLLRSEDGVRLVGHGGRFIADKIPIGQTVTVYAANALLKEAIDQTEAAITAVSNGSVDPEDWRAIEVGTNRIKSRSITLVTVLRSLLKSQER